MYRAKNDKGTSGLRVLVCLLALLGILTTGQSLRAQSSNGQITGLITDSSGAAVQDAKIIATNAERASPTSARPTDLVCTSSRS